MNHIEHKIIKVLSSRAFHYGLIAGIAIGVMIDSHQVESYLSIIYAISSEVKGQ
jgi:hypothetical protein